MPDFSMESFTGSGQAGRTVFRAARCKRCLRICSSQQSGIIYPPLRMSKRVHIINNHSVLLKSNLDVLELGDLFMLRHPGRGTALEDIQNKDIALIIQDIQRLGLDVFAFYINSNAHQWVSMILRASSLGFMPSYSSCSPSISP